MTTLAGPRLSKNVLNYVFGSGTVARLAGMVNARRGGGAYAVYCIDSFFKDTEMVSSVGMEAGDELLWVDASNEPTTTGIDALTHSVRSAKGPSLPGVVVGIGGGATLDTAKAVSNLLSNGGDAADYQGWDLVKNVGVFKIGVPTISGTGAEASRTCVMINPSNGLKLGMNSDHTVFDQLILDPELTRSVPREQYFFTGMDTYVHCIESLSGRHRNAIGDAFSRQALALCRQVFLSDDMMSEPSREALMVASYLGGCAIANSYVGVVHPFSAGLSVVLGIHHCKANCIAMTAMEEFYPAETREFMAMADKQGISIPRGLCRGLTTSLTQRIYEATIVHEKPLSNALGTEFRSLLTPAKVKSVFERM